MNVNRRKFLSGAALASAAAGTAACCGMTKTSQSPRQSPWTICRIPRPELLEALCAFADQLATRSDPGALRAALEQLGEPVAGSRPGAAAGAWPWREGVQARRGPWSRTCAVPLARLVEAPVFGDPQRGIAVPLRLHVHAAGGRRAMPPSDGAGTGPQCGPHPLHDRMATVPGSDSESLRRMRSAMIGSSQCRHPFHCSRRYHHVPERASRIYRAPRNF